jgi:hypothetical protein
MYLLAEFGEEQTEKELAFFSQMLTQLPPESHVSRQHETYRTKFYNMPKVR